MARTLHIGTAFQFCILEENKVFFSRVVREKIQLSQLCVFNFVVSFIIRDMSYECVWYVNFIWESQSTIT